MLNLNRKMKIMGKSLRINVTIRIVHCDLFFQCQDIPALTIFFLISRSAAQSDCEISIGNFVSVINSSSIARVQRMYESGKKKKYFHAQWFM